MTQSCFYQIPSASSSCPLHARQLTAVFPRDTPDPQLEACWSALAASRVPARNAAGTRSFGRLSSGRLTCEGIFCPDFQQRLPSAGHHSAARTGVTPPPPWLPFSFVPPALALSAALVFPSLLEIITRHVRRPVRGGGVVTLPLKFLIV